MEHATSFAISVANAPRVTDIYANYEFESSSDIHDLNSFYYSCTHVLPSLIQPLSSGEDDRYSNSDSEEEYANFIPSLDISDESQVSSTLEREEEGNLFSFSLTQFTLMLLKHLGLWIELESDTAGALSSAQGSSAAGALSENAPSPSRPHPISNPASGSRAAQSLRPTSNQQQSLAVAPQPSSSNQQAVAHP
ncbi:hypothetical protein EV424DRAFT_1351630 [Suillus variegatus]|nr:hypothetical protein EV424DRAFT_1351630 [Suillus variegatus]